MQLTDSRNRVFVFIVALHICVLARVMAEDDNASDNEKALENLDDGLDDEETFYPVFVRFEKQLFRKSGDYELFCKQHNSQKRSASRELVLNALKKNHEASWATAEEVVRELGKQDQIKNVERYWIVNGFACEASGRACRELAGEDGVSFIYRQRVPYTPPLHFRPTPLASAPTQQQNDTYRSVLKQWKDDSDTPVKTAGHKVPWNVQRIHADQAWEEENATGKGIVVALSDSGLMVTPSLVQALWKNPDEKLNGLDDDNNGLVDDLFGYDFAAQRWYCLGDGPLMTHGSMCGGIIAGRPHNKEKLITGVAPRARLMVLRGMGLLKSYEYALAEGADVMSMSYMFVRVPLGNYRGLYRLAHEHLAAGGIVAVGGAGNFRRNKPAGQQIAIPKDIPCVIAAAGIVEDGTQAIASSEGPVYWNGVKFYDDYSPDAPLAKPDVTGCFGGYPVWGRPAVTRRMRAWKLVSDEGGGIGLITGPQGNSFSGPHAAGVAALMLSVNPELPPWRIKELMEQTCEDIGPPGRDPKFGAGLLDALEAVKAAKKAG